MSVLPQLYLFVVPSPTFPGELVHPKFVIELASKMLVTNQPLSGNTTVGLSVGFNVGETLGDFVGETVGLLVGEEVGLELGEKVGLTVGSGGISIPVISNSAKLTPF